MSLFLSLFPLFGFFVLFSFSCFLFVVCGAVKRERENTYLITFCSFVCFFGREREEKKRGPRYVTQEEKRKKTKSPTHNTQKKHTSRGRHAKEKETRNALSRSPSLLCKSTTTKTTTKTTTVGIFLRRLRERDSPLPPFLLLLLLLPY